MFLVTFLSPLPRILSAPHLFPLSTLLLLVVWKDVLCVYIKLNHGLGCLDGSDPAQETEASYCDSYYLKVKKLGQQYIKVHLTLNTSPPIYSVSFWAHLVNRLSL